MATWAVIGKCVSLSTFPWECETLYMLGQLTLAGNFLMMDRIVLLMSTTTSYDMLIQ